MSLPKYKYLLSYRTVEIIADLNVEFIKRWISPKSRTHDQMTQAGRSGKQNIIEGVADSRTSTNTELKLLGVANGSLEELLADYEDFLRQHDLKIWAKDDPRVLAFRKTIYRLSHISNLSPLGQLIEKPQLPQNPEEAANFMLTLLHMATYLLSRQIKAVEEKFIKEGGYSENLLKKRLEQRKSLR